MDDSWLLVLVVAGLVISPGCAQLQKQFQEEVSGTLRGPGSNYQTYLTGQGTLLLELDYAPGNEPHSDVLDKLRNQLERGTSQNVKIVTSKDLPDNDGKSWTTPELKKLADKHRDEKATSSRAVMHGLYVDGDHQNKGDAIGLAYSADEFAVFMGKAREVTCPNGAFCPTQVQRYKVVRSVSVHEAGHLVGLVDSPLPMIVDHNDPDHPAHSKNKDSVMFWKINSGKSITDLFGGGGPPYEFDSNDVKDMKNAKS